MPGSFLTDDLNTFFNTSDFATSVTYTPSGGSPSTINVIYDDSHIDINPITGDVINTDIVVLCKKTDVPTIKPGDIFTISTVSHTVIRPQPSATNDTIEVILTKTVA